MKQNLKKKLEQYLGQLVYGAIDGSVTTFAVVAGAAGAKLSSAVIIILGFANLIADGFSMGASAYLAAKSERDLKKSKDASHDDGETPLGDGMATFGAFIVIGFLPFCLYVVDAVFGLGWDATALFVASSALTGLAFVAIGLIKARVTKTGRLRAATETLVLGGIAASLAYVLGDLLAKALGAS